MRVREGLRKRERRWEMRGKREIREIKGRWTSGKKRVEALGEVWVSQAK